MSAFTEYFVNNRENSEERAAMIIHSCPELLERIQQVGFLPLLESGVRGYSAESLMDEDCRFTQFDDGSWEWPLWQWKGCRKGRRLRVWQVLRWQGRFCQSRVVARPVQLAPKPKHKIRRMQR